MSDAPQQDRELAMLHGRVSLLVRGYLLFAVIVVIALMAIGVLVKSVHSAQESHFSAGQSERGLILQQNGEILDILRGHKR